LTLNGDPHITGIELLGKVIVDDEHTHTYLHHLQRLVKADWLVMNSDQNNSYLGQPPYTFIHAQCEFGDRLHEVLGEGSGPAAAFTGNEQYLEAMFAYLNNVSANKRHPLKSAGAGDKPDKRPADPALKRLEERARRAKVALPAVALRHRFGLSIYQHLCLLGMYGQQEGEIDYDFSDPKYVVRMFSRGIDAR